jgi:hypothetical protein
VQKHGEVFTPAWVVNDMLDMFPAEVWKAGKTFLEPACGEGAFLIEVLRRKLENIKSETQEEWEWQAVIATSSIYGIELLEDNAERCTMNLMRVFAKFYNKKFLDTQNEEVIKAIQFIVSRNIIQGNALTYKQGNGQPIVFSEWTPVIPHQFKRKDYTYEGIIKADEQQKANKGTLFEEENNNIEIGLIKEYEPVNWKDIGRITLSKQKLIK